MREGEESPTSKGLQTVGLDTLGLGIAYAEREPFPVGAEEVSRRFSKRWEPLETARAVQLTMTWSLCRRSYLS